MANAIAVSTELAGLDVRDEDTESKCAQRIVGSIDLCRLEATERGPLAERARRLVSEPPGHDTRHFISARHVPGWSA